MAAQGGPVDMDMATLLKELKAAREENKELQRRAEEEKLELQKEKRRADGLQRQLKQQDQDAELTAGVAKLSLLSSGTGSSVPQSTNPFTTPQRARNPITMLSYLRTLDSAPTVSQLISLKAAIIPTERGENVVVKLLEPKVWSGWTAEAFLQSATDRKMMMMYYSPDGEKWQHADGIAFQSFLVHAVEGKVIEGCKSSKSDVTAHLWLWPTALSPPGTPEDKTRGAGGCSPEEVRQLMSGDPAPLSGSEENKAEALPPLPTVERIGNAFPFLGRERTVDTVKRVVADLFERFCSRHPYSLDVKKLSRVLICYAAYGAGKSRFGKEVPVALCRLLGHASVGTARDSELLTALQHPFHVSLEMSMSEVKDRVLRHLFSLVFSKGQRYAAFEHRFPSIDEFTRACEAHKGWTADSVAMLLQPDKGFRVCFVHMDEAQELLADEMRAVTRMLTSVWGTEYRTLFVPLFTGTNPTRLTNSSGAREEVLRLEPLSADTVWSIMQAVCKLDGSREPGRYLRLFLDAISYCPRLLQVSRFATHDEIAVLNAFWRQLALLVMSSFPNHDAHADFLTSRCSLENVQRFLVDKADDSAAWSKLFKQMSSSLVQVGVKTAVDLEVLDDTPRDALLGHVLAEIQVQLKDRIGKVTVGDLVQKGLVFLEPAGDTHFYMRMPFLYVWSLYHLGRTPEALHRCSLLTTPSVDKMEPGSNEQQDLAFLCFRLWVSGFLEKDQRTLDFVLGQIGGELDYVVVGSEKARLDMCPAPNQTDPLTSNDCSAIMTAFTKREPVALLAKPGNSGPDSAVCVWVQSKSGTKKKLPAFWGGRANTDAVPDTVWATLRKVKTQSSAYGLSSTEEKDDSSTVRALFKSADTKSGGALSENWGIGKLGVGEWQPLVIFIQSKLKKNTSNLLSVNDVWVEYLKCHKIGCGRFVLLLITDGPTPAVPEALRGHVWLVTQENMVDFFGPLLGKRRQAVRF